MVHSSDYGDGLRRCSDTPPPLLAQVGSEVNGGGYVVGFSTHRTGRLVSR